MLRTACEADSGTICALSRVWIAVSNGLELLGRSVNSLGASRPSLLALVY